MRIAFIGPPGAGKYTQATRVGRSLPSHNHSPSWIRNYAPQPIRRAASPTKVSRVVDLEVSTTTNFAS
jgi:hypothetical protein